MLLVATIIIGVLGLDILGTIIMGFIINIPISKSIVLSLTLCLGI